MRARARRGVERAQRLTRTGRETAAAVEATLRLTAVQVAVEHGIRASALLLSLAKQHKVGDHPV